MDNALAIADVFLFMEAEEKAAKLRRRIAALRTKRKKQRRRRWLTLAIAVGLEQQATARYVQPNYTVPILDMYFNNGDPKPAMRLSRTSITRVLQLLPREKHHGWSHEMEVLVTIYWLACGASYRQTGDVCAIPLSTVWRIVHSTVEKMMTILHSVIHFPKEDAMEAIGAGFARMAGHDAFKYAAGAIDGCHIRIVPPAEPQRASYINRKLFPSIILQAICDAQGAFLDVFVGNPGSVHDALVLRRCPMYKESLYPPAGYFLLGDRGYPCLQRPVCLMTPYRQPLAGQVEAQYNRHHARGRNVIERAFGMLKTRWRSIFLRAVEVRPKFAPLVVGACCILHNICVASEDVLEEPEEGDDGEDEEQTEPAAIETSGNRMRARLAAEMSAPAQLHNCLREHDYM